MKIRFIAMKIVYKNLSSVKLLHPSFELNYSQKLAEN